MNHILTIMMAKCIKLPSPKTYTHGFKPNLHSKVITMPNYPFEVKFSKTSSKNKLNGPFNFSFGSNFTCLMHGYLPCLYPPITTLLKLLSILRNLQGYLMPTNLDIIVCYS